MTYRPSTTSMPERTSSTFDGDSLATLSVRNDLSSATICDTLATESLESLVERAPRSTLPGASADLRLPVSGTHTTVAMRLRLRASPCTTAPGLRQPASEPAGGGISPHQTSPFEI